MQRKVNFNLESFEAFKNEDYPEDKFSIAKTCFLSTAKNAHKLDISDEVLRRDAKSILGNFLVAKLEYGDATTHLPDEIIFGYFPKDQEVEFREDGNITKAYAYAVISKQYGYDLVDIFSEDNLRNVSVEMKTETDDDNENKVLGFDIYGLTCLGTTVKGSCPDAKMSIVRFSETEAENFFKKSEGSLCELKQFMQERNQKMAEKKTYKVDKSKEAVSDTPWGEVNKTELRNKVMDASNRDSLVRDVYMIVEEGWQDAPSEKLKYPVMQLKGDTFVYNRYGLSSALGYAEKENETEVVRKVKSLYKKLDIDEGDKKMAEIEGRKAWGKVIDKVQDHEGKGAYVDSIEDDHIIYTKEGVRYRVNAKITVDPDDKTVAADIEWGSKKKDADQKMAEDKKDKDSKMSDDEHDDHDDDDDKDDDDDDDDKHDEHMSDVDAKMAKLQKDIEERDNIIMEKESELKKLREFKRGYEDKQKADHVETVMADVKDCLADDDYKKLRDEGMACPFEEIDGWANKVKAIGFERTKKGKKTKDDLWRMSAPAENFNTQKTGSVWDKL